MRLVGRMSKLGYIVPVYNPVLAEGRPEATSQARATRFRNLSFAPAPRSQLSSSVVHDPARIAASRLSLSHWTRTYLCGWGRRRPSIWAGVLQDHLYIAVIRLRVEFRQHPVHFRRHRKSRPRSRLFRANLFNAQLVQVLARAKRFSPRHRQLYCDYAREPS